MFFKIGLLLGVVEIVKFSKITGVYAFTESNVENPVNLPEFKSTEVREAKFVEQFTDDWKSRWTISTAARRLEGNTTLFYDGVWEVEEPYIYKGINGDKGLVVKKAAAHHAISAKFSNPLNNKEKTLVVQYEVKFQNSLECGGAYLKLITESKEDIRYKEFNDKTPYTIMFGPDKCGVTNKVHFILRHKNPLTNEYEEKHFKTPPLVEDTKMTTLYTLIIKPDQTFEIRINNKLSKKGSLLLDFTPPINPPQYIPDPNDKKPDDWVDESKIVDPNAKKPDDWDEDEPYEIPDPDAVKPADWLEDEPLMIPDPNVSVPKDWNAKEDGEFVTPMIPNPLCKTVSGCGPFKPLIRNPKYKGKWIPPLIDNPKYIGKWEPRTISNPHYYEDKTPSNLESLIGVGFELWTMQNDILFDNIYIGHSIKEAEEFARATFQVKYDNEVSQEKVSSPSETPADVIEEKSYYTIAVKKVFAFIDLVKSDPISALKQMPRTASTLGIVFFTFIALFFGIASLFFNFLKFHSNVNSKACKSEARNDDLKTSDLKINGLSNDEHDSLETETVTSTKRRTRHTE